MDADTNGTGVRRGWDPGDLTGLSASAQALNRTVDGLTQDDLDAASLLPGWTRAHVVAHLAMNAHALAGVLDAVGRGEPVAMYASDSQRDDDIADLAQRPVDDLREALLAGTTRFADAVGAMTPDRWDGVFNRLPGGPVWPAVTIVPTRRREVEIHHADLAAAYTHRDWPSDFVAELLDATSVDQGGSGPFRVRATDLGRDWTVGGQGGPTVMGAGADLGWWLTGRGASSLSCDEGDLPALGAWQRATARAVDLP